MQNCRLGDFNSNSGHLATQVDEMQHEFVNCISARAEKALLLTGGQVNLCIMHQMCQEEDMGVDHIFARVPRQSSPLLLAGTS